MSGDNNTQNFNPFNDGTRTIYSQDPDGTRVISHVDADGEVILEEYDFDQDGTYEASAEYVGDGSDDVLVHQDLDQDGKFDTRDFYDPGTGQSYQKDYLVDDEVVVTVVDTDGNQVADYQLMDTTGDGNFDTVYVDSDGDGVANAEFVDTNADGEFDFVNVDAEKADGLLDTTVTANQYGGEGALGSVSEYEEFVTYPGDEDAFSGSDAAGDDYSSEGAV